MTRYVSTRGGSPPIGFAEVLLSGPAADGGLVMPEAWPAISAGEIASYAGRPYADVAFAILRRFVGDAFAADALRADIDAAYARFDDPRVAPLREIKPGLFLLELFHGPTLAFKDIAMQLLARLFARVLDRRGTRATVLCATSGDTGAAAVEAFRGFRNVDAVVLHPKDRVSGMQRRQMTTAREANVHNIAVEGSFDDAQAIVKTLFADEDFADHARLAAVNSINFARIAAQCVYYFTATAALGRPATFVVPTGNFGDIFAGEAAARMGLKLSGLVIATNANDTLARMLETGVYAPAEARPTLSPAMDIQIPSNFERALFEASGRDMAWLSGAMRDFAKARRIEIRGDVLAALRARYRAGCAGDTETLAAIAKLRDETGVFADPHTAVGLAVSEKMKSETTGPVIVLATAHPAKFPEAIELATGEAPELPAPLAAIRTAEERFTVLPAEAQAVKSFIMEHVAAS